jgi:hypothetical protein
MPKEPLLQLKPGLKTLVCEQTQRTLPGVRHAALCTQSHAANLMGSYISTYIGRIQLES